jgi:site-specific DNA-methyltransferase (cytosine-N4-specific)
MIAAGVKVQCVVTSPPYWGLRDYGASGQFGLERTWIRHVARARGVFRLVREVLADDGLLWMNYGDSYAGAPGGWQGKNGQRASRTFTARIDLPKRGNGLKPKDLVGMPWRVALALQDDGWWLRSDIIWHKPNVMPESVTDRPTKAHEYVFMLAKSAQYYYDLDALSEQSSPDTHARAARGRSESHKWADGGPGNQTIAKVSPSAGRVPGVGPKAAKADSRLIRSNESYSAAIVDVVATRNARTVWTIPTQPFPGAHFATFPEALVSRCILAGSRPGDTVLDPFMGSGTVGKVATDLGRNFIGCELNPKYVELHDMRRTTTGMAI